jgi:hypothetical protein
MPPRGNAGRSAAAADGGLASAEAGDPPGTQADITLDPGALDDGGCDGSAAHLHHLQQQQLQQQHHHALLAQAAQQQPWLFSGLGGAPAPPQSPAADLTSVLAALSTIEIRITARLDPLEAGLADLRNNVASASSAPASSPVEGRGRVSFGTASCAPRARSASPTGSATGSETASRASTEDLCSSLDALLGVVSGDLAHDLLKCGLSPAWALAVKSTGSKISGEDIVNLSTLLIVGRMLQHLAWIVYQMHDDPSAVPRDQIEDVFPHIAVARDALTTRLNHYQLLASGLDAKSAAALADAAAFKRRVDRHGDDVLAGLPIACPHLAELFANFQKKAMDKAVKALHDPQAKSGKTAASPDDDDIDSLRAQLEKSEARATKLEARLSDANRKPHGPRASKDADSRPLAPKKADKPKSPAPPASTDADASA